MLIGNVFEEIHDTSAVINCAQHLADEVRNIWLDKRDRGISEWEESFGEKSDVMHLLRAEGFDRLDSIDYVFRWWGNKDNDDLAGQIDVIWKIASAQEGGQITYYKTWLRLAERDFTMGTDKTENAKRRRFRSEVCEAFEIWKKNYPESR